VEDDVKKGIILAFGCLFLLAGCDNKDKSAGIPVGPKWKGAPYRISFDTAEAKPNPAGVTIPVVKFTANPDALEKRATLVIKFDASGATKQQGPIGNQVIVAPVDISGAEGALPADYMAEADKGLARFLGAYCIKGKVKISVALARSSLNAQATDDEVDKKRLSDWLPVEVTFKNPHPGC
jgi:uncharacterized lipoprotein NlpE involved in copper resistance